MVRFTVITPRQGPRRSEIKAMPKVYGVILLARDFLPLWTFWFTGGLTPRQGPKMYCTTWWSAVAQDSDKTG